MANTTTSPESRPAEKETSPLGGTLTVEDWKKVDKLLGKMDELRHAIQLSSVYLGDLGELARNTPDGQSLCFSPEAEAERQRTCELDEVFGVPFVPRTPPYLENIISDSWDQDRGWHPMLRTLRAFQQQNTLEALARDTELERQENRAKEWLKRNGSRETAETVQRVVDLLTGIEEERRKLPEMNPDAWLALHTKTLAGYLADLERGRLVRVPYLLEKKEELERSLETKNFVFIAGETGAGKTELAKLAERERTGQDPIVVRCYSGMDSSELFGHLALTATDAKRAAELPDAILAEFAKWEEAHPQVTDKEKQDAALNQITQRMLHENKATITEYVLGAMYLGAKTGRMVLLDEGNYMPPGLIPKLYEVLIRKPGDKINVQEDGLDPVEVQGIRVVMTGNDNKKRYKNRNEMDRALIDRGGGTMTYDFLPQALDGQYYEYDLKQKQLFAIALVAALKGHTLERSDEGITGVKGRLREAGADNALVAPALNVDLGPVRLPEGSLEKLWELSRLAAITQQVFAEKLGKKDDPYAFQNSAAPAVVQINRAISPRGLIGIVEDWIHDGFRYELDHYVFRFLVERTTDVQQQAYFYQLAHRCANFFQSDGWDQNPDYGRNGVVTNFAVKNPQNRGPELKLYSAQELLEALFGPCPSRSEWPEKVDRTGEETQELNAQRMAALEQFAQVGKQLVDLMDEHPWLAAKLPEETKLMLSLWRKPEQALLFFLQRSGTLTKEELIAAAEGRLDEYPVAAQALMAAGWVPEKE